MLSNSGECLREKDKDGTKLGGGWNYRKEIRRGPKIGIRRK